MENKNTALAREASLRATKDMPLIGEGATADVYRYSDTTILKLFKKAYGAESVRYEASIAEAVGKTDIPAAAYRGIVTIDGRDGIIYDFVPGLLLLFSLLASSIPEAVAIAKKLARMHGSINSVRTGGLPDQKDRLSYLIGRAEGIDAYRDIILAWLASRPQGGAVCHGDLHAGNVIVSEGKYVAIDWMNAYSGEREGDALRSYLMMVSPYLPITIPFWKKPAFTLFKKLIAEAYLGEYLRITGAKRKDILAWWPAIAAARLSDNVPGEREWLARKIEKNIRRL